jgi:hypothetical protein
MFPFWGYPYCGTQYDSRREYQERKLRFLKWMRDELETRISGINASIETLERQLREDRG